jgi:3-oxoacyl-[acyl-carrier protein] reductase
VRILITGATRGLGLVAADAFEAEGHQVMRWGRAQLDYLNLKGWDCLIPEYNKIDVIIHCAGGGLGLRGPYLTAEAAYQLFMVNLGGAMELNRIVVPEMQHRGSGNVIHVCSIASGEAVGSVGYNTVKAALGAYVRSLGRELAPYGVVVTGIAPGGFQAPRNSMERLSANNPPAYQEFIEKRLPRGKMGEAHELIPLLKYLASPEASMMGGCVVPIDAGEGRYY